jgi:hypothetical protein
MKVLQQLIKHFWDRGSLTMDQAHYLVEHGFIRCRELENYEPREGARALDDEGVDRADYELQRIEVLLPDDLERQENALESRAPGKRKAGKSKPKAPELSLEKLGEELRPEISVRAGYLPALIELASCLREVVDVEEATIALRQQGVDAFRELLVQATETRPGILRDLWCALDVRPFHDLLNAWPHGGRVATAYRAVLNAESAAAWAAHGWIMQVPEMRMVSNLLCVRRRLLAVLTWLLDNAWARLTKCVQAPRGPSSYAAWDVGFLGLVLVVNARDQRLKRKPAGYRYPRWHGPKTWCEAWETALALDPVAVMPFLIHVYGSAAAPSQDDTASLSEREDIEIVCPYEWKR